MAETIVGHSIKWWCKDMVPETEPHFFGTWWDKRPKPSKDRNMWGSQSQPNIPSWLERKIAKSLDGDEREIHAQNMTSVMNMKEIR